MIFLCIFLAVVYAALVLSRQRSSNIEGWHVVKVLKQQERVKQVELEVVLEERAACAAIAEMVERDKNMPDSMRSVAARIRVLIQARSIKPQP
jgi:hypothetical protein